MRRGWEGGQAPTSPTCGSPTPSCPSWLHPHSPPTPRRQAPDSSPSPSAHPHPSASWAYCGAVLRRGDRAGVSSVEAAPGIWALQLQAYPGLTLITSSFFFPPSLFSRLKKEGDKQL